MPPALQNIFNGPYREGVSAITSVLDTQGRAGVDALLADPPASTEQLLHPDKLADREPPLTISDPDVIEALGPGWTAIDSDTFGEFQLRVYLDVELSRAAAAAGAGYRWTGENQAFWVYGREADTWLLVATDADDLNRVAAAVLQPLAEVG